MLQFWNHLLWIYEGNRFYLLIHLTPLNHLFKVLTSSLKILPNNRTNNAFLMVLIQSSKNITHRTLNTINLLHWIPQLINLSFIISCNIKNGLLRKLNISNQSVPKLSDNIINYDSKRFDNFVQKIVTLIRKIFHFPFFWMLLINFKHLLYFL